MAPEISIIVPVYNTAPYLPRCIDSILNQSFTDFELLLVDDGSTDVSGATCAAYAERDSRIRLFQKGHGGVSSARNVGLANAKGNWISFVDSDDWVEDSFFNDLPLTDAVDFVCCPRKFSDGTLDVNPPSGIYRGESCNSLLLGNCHTNLIKTCIGRLFKRSVISENKILFNENLRFGEDRIFVMEYFANCSSIHIQANGYYMYDRCCNWESKYVVSFREAEMFMASFMDIYDCFPIQSTKIASIAGFIVGFIDSEEKNLRLRKALSKPFLRYRRAIFDEKPAVFKIKYHVSRIMSMIVHV